MAKRLAKRLLDRQVSLLDYLTSGDAIFGDETDGARDRGARWASTRGLLRLEARVFAREAHGEDRGRAFRARSICWATSRRR